MGVKCTTSIVNPIGKKEGQYFEIEIPNGATEVKLKHNKGLSINGKDVGTGEVRRKATRKTFAGTPAKLKGFDVYNTNGELIDFSPLFGKY